MAAALRQSSHSMDIGGQIANGAADDELMENPALRELHADFPSPRAKQRLEKMAKNAGKPYYIGDDDVGFIFMPSNDIEKLQLGSVPLTLRHGDHRVSKGSLVYVSDDDNSKWQVFLHFTDAFNGTNLNQIRVAIFCNGFRFPYDAPAELKIPI